MNRLSLWLVLCVFLCLGFADAAELSAFVTDNAGILSAQEKNQIEGVLRGLYNQELAQFAVVTVQSLEGNSINAYALELAQGVLGDKEKNNGLLLLIALDERQYRFEVGRGLEADLPDSKIGRIGRQYLQTNFRSGAYGKGIYEASLAVAATLGADTESAYYIPETRPQSAGMGSFWSLFVIFLVISALLGSFGKNRRDYRRRDQYFDAALMAAMMFGGRGRGGFGGLSGGFGGFGGGGFGGGGAGGSW